MGNSWDDRCKLRICDLLHRRPDDRSGLPQDAAKCITAGASGHAILDAMKLGYVGGWLRAAALMDAAGLPTSCHAFPEFSVHLLGATPTCHWLEYFDHVGPLLRQPLRIQAGQALIPDRPGSGLEWSEDAIRHALR